MKKIYGNRQLLATLDNMNKTGRLAQSVIFYGEKGCGKKLMADYYASMLLCEFSENGSPCGKCAACRNIASMSHPDVCYIEKEGKKNGYGVKTARAVIRDAAVKPNNNTARKIYIFQDCSDITNEAQNALLKLIEEPPPYAYFIFTADSKSRFLPTIISRCVCFGVSVCTEHEAEMSLVETGFGQEESAEAVKCFHGNIGRCTEYIVSEDVRAQVDLTKRIADSIIRKDEYGLNEAFYSAGSNRENIREILVMTDRLVRDAAVFGKDKNAAGIGCFREAAMKMSGMLTVYQAVNIHNAIENAWKAVEANVQAPVAMAAMCAEIMQIVS